MHPWAGSKVRIDSGAIPAKLIGLILPALKADREAELGASGKVLMFSCLAGTLPAGNRALYWECGVFRRNPARIRAPLRCGLRALALTMECRPGFPKKLQENLGMGFRTQLKAGI